MIYFFTWNSEYLLKEYINWWKNLFIKKYWDFNLLYIKNISDLSENILIENITWSSFLSEKRLIIIDSLPISKWEKNKNITFLEDSILANINNISENNIVVFCSINPDKRSKLYKKLLKISKIKEFNIKSEFDIKKTIENKYKWKINNNAINTIIKYKSWNLNKIINELEKLFILNEIVNNDCIIKNIEPEIDESIFMFINDILNLKIKEWLNKLSNILQNINIYAFYNAFLSNIRNIIYIYVLKNKWLLNNKITEVLKLWKRWFIVQKNYQINLKDLSKLYISLINLDKQMKTGKLIWTREKDFICEFENILLKLSSILS